MSPHRIWRNKFGVRRVITTEPLPSVSYQFQGYTRDMPPELLERIREYKRCHEDINLELPDSYDLLSALLDHFEGITAEDIAETNFDPPGG